MPPAASRLGPFIVDRVAYQATRDGETVDLTSKLLAVLIHPVDRGEGPLIGREDLRFVDASPSLGTGKVDLRAVRQLAAGASEAVA